MGRTSLKSQARSRLRKEHATGAVASAQARLDQLARQADTYRADNPQLRQALISCACALAGALIAIMIWRDTRS